MNKLDKQFHNRVYALVSQIPRARFMTYGQIAALCGNPRSARIVGGVAHFGDPDLPWQRVVHKDGSLAVGFPGGVEGHKQILETEGVKISKDFKVNIDKLLWHPDLPEQ